MPSAMTMTTMMTLGRRTHCGGGSFDILHRCSANFRFKFVEKKNRKRKQKSRNDTTNEEGVGCRRYPDSATSLSPAWRYHRPRHRLGLCLHPRLISGPLGLPALGSADPEIFNRQRNTRNVSRRLVVVFYGICGFKFLAIPRLSSHLRLCIVNKSLPATKSKCQLTH